jgi:methionyl-tRNA formyltransferase
LPDKIINLHISLLPYNRGSNPNVWSFLEDTPKGVTIHYIDEGIDTGDILFQKEIIFEEDNETLSSSYNKLNKEMQSFFIDNWEAIKEFHFSPMPQPNDGSIHSVEDFKRIGNILGKEDWNINIKELKKRYGKLKDEHLNGN